jgi:hypothetical protein
MASIADGQGPVVTTGSTTFRGRIRDYDYIENSDWVLAIVSQPPNEVQVWFRDPRFARIMETALDMQANVDITYDTGEKRLLFVKLEVVPPPPPPPPMSWSVMTLSFDEASGKCRAKLLGTPPAVEAFTRDVRAEGVLATSLRSKKPVSYLETVPDGTEQRITRVKINIP